MELKEKTSRYFAFLKKEREQYLESVARIGAKLLDLNDGDYDLEEFIESCVPPRHYLKNKILHHVEKSQTSLAARKDDPPIDLDSSLVDALKSRYDEFQKEFDEIIRATDPDCSEPKNHPGKRSEKRRSKPTQRKKKEHLDTQYLDLPISPGESCKIIVQRNRTDAARSDPSTDKHNFEDDNLETFVIRRSGHGDSRH